MESRLRGRSRWFLLLLTGLLLSGLTATVVWAGTDAPAAPDWLEPRGINIVELIGQVPEETLQGMIISWGDAQGPVVYESGTRMGDTVVVSTTIYPRLYARDWAPNKIMTVFGCLGQRPMYDHLGSVVPPSTLRIYDSQGTDVTDQIQNMFLTLMDSQEPLASSLQYYRYPLEGYGVLQPYPLTMGPDGLTIPSNGGCDIWIPGADIYPLTGVFTLDFPAAVEASVVGTQQATFQSYIGGGGVGVFRPLMAQLRKLYPDRHARIPLEIPDGADHILVKFPPQPGDPWADSNIPPPHYNADRPAAGTYRLGRNIVELSGDLTFSAAFPLKVAWQDADQARGSEFLPEIRSPNEIAPPEYVLPAGIPYDDCFTQGDCSSAVLQAIYDAESDLEFIYLSVTATAGTGEWIPVKMAGPGWPKSALSNLTAISSELEHMPVLGGIQSSATAGDDAVQPLGPILTITKVVSPSTSVPRHSPVTYTICFSNAGDEGAIGVVLTDPLPLHITFDQWVEQPPGALASSDQITWTGSLSAGQAITLTFVASQTADYGQTVVNTAEYSYTTGRSTASATFTVQQPSNSDWSVYLPVILRSPEEEVEPTGTPETPEPTETPVTPEPPETPETPEPPDTPEPPAGVSSGWFDTQGRMLDFATASK